MYLHKHSILQLSRSHKLQGHILLLVCLLCAVLHHGHDLKRFPAYYPERMASIHYKETSAGLLYVRAHTSAHGSVHRVAAWCALWYWHPAAYINWSTAETICCMVFSLYLFTWNMTCWFHLAMCNLACLPTHLWTLPLCCDLGMPSGLCLLSSTLYFAQLLLTLACSLDFVFASWFGTMLLVCSWPQFVPWPYLCLLNWYPAALLCPPSARASTYSL